MLITQWAGQAWDEVRTVFDFDAAARKVGMLITINGSNDDLISFDGVDKYTFTEADAGDLPDLYVSDEAEEEEVSDKDTDEGGEQQEWEPEEEDEKEQENALPLSPRTPSHSHTPGWARAAPARRCIKGRGLCHQPTSNPRRHAT